MFVAMYIPLPFERSPQVSSARMGGSSSPKKAPTRPMSARTPQKAANTGTKAGPYLTSKRNDRRSLHSVRRTLLRYYHIEGEKEVAPAGGSDLDRQHFDAKRGLAEPRPNQRNTRVVMDSPCEDFGGGLNSREFS